MINCEKSVPSFHPSPFASKRLMNRNDNSSIELLFFSSLRVSTASENDRDEDKKSDQGSRGGEKSERENRNEFCLSICVSLRFLGNPKLPGLAWSKHTKTACRANYSKAPKSDWRTLEYAKHDSAVAQVLQMNPIFRARATSPRPSLPSVFVAFFLLLFARCWLACRLTAASRFIYAFISVAFR